VACEVAGKKLRVNVSAIHMFDKEIFLKEAKYLGELRQERVKEINEKIKLILELD
jgi:mRNA-degrading endonuclease toxin of MazEF toxin-antitoxin module